MSTSRGNNVFILSPFGALDTSLERYIQGVNIPFNLESTFDYILNVVDPQKCHLGPQNDPRSLGLEKL
jgi:hypothetical protein